MKSERFWHSPQAGGWMPVCLCWTSVWFDIVLLETAFGWVSTIAVSACVTYPGEDFKNPCNSAPPSADFVGVFKKPMAVAFPKPLLLLRWEKPAQGRCDVLHCTVFCCPEVTMLCCASPLTCHSDKSSPKAQIAGTEERGKRASLKWHDVFKTLFAEMVFLNMCFSILLRANKMTLCYVWFACLLLA